MLMSKIKELREKRQELGKTIYQLRDKLTAGGEWTAEERGQWEKVNGEFDKIGRDIDALSRADEVARVLDERRDGTPGAEDTGKTRREKRNKGKAGHEVTEEMRALALQAWVIRGAGGELSKRHVEACRATGMRPNARFIDIALPRKPGEKRAQSAVTAAAGAYLIPTVLTTNLEVGLKDYNGVRQVAEVIRTDGGNPYDWPTMNDTGSTGALLAENTAASDGDLTFGKQTWNAYKYSSNMVKVPTELDEDEAIGLAEKIGAALGERIGRIQATHFTTGTGSSQPAGIVTGSTLGKTAASATAITFDEVLDLFYSLDPAYRNDPSFGFMCHDGIALVLRKLKDAEGRYLWSNGTQEGSPEKINGKPLTINMAMQATVATATKTLLCGAMSKYKIRDVKGLRVRRLVERYADADQVGYITFMRSDGKVLNPGTNPIKHLLQA
jgi:HK97 family phage major capsid protein